MEFSLLSPFYLVQGLKHQRGTHNWSGPPHLSEPNLETPWVFPDPVKLTVLTITQGFLGPGI